jgi:hypothetical protein
MPQIVPPVPMPATKWLTRPRSGARSPGLSSGSWRPGSRGCGTGQGGRRPGSPRRGAPSPSSTSRVIRGHCRRAEDHLGPVGTKQRHLLRGHLVGHDEDAAVAAPGGHDGEADAGVAGGALDDRRARPSSPSRSAASIIATAGRSLTLPPGLRISSLAISGQGRSRPIRSRRTIGVLPTRSSNESATSIFGPGSVSGTTSTPVSSFLADTSSSVCSSVGSRRCAA